MKTPNTIERDINRIRLKIYEETKDMTPAQRVDYYRRNTEPVIKKYGLKLVASAKGK